ncbi:hypothetical protein, partial [Dyella sp.]|uniref:hypothetical protein n=1 Tax=Dyella sp. TaxID=1869338 RepID=UPI002FDA99CB
MSIQAIHAAFADHQPAGLDNGPANAATYTLDRGVTPADWGSIPITRSAGFPSLPPDAPDFLRGSNSPSPGDQALSKYRVDPNELNGLQPDEKGVYSRLNGNGTKDDFIKLANGDAYKVGEFDSSTKTWPVLDPQTEQTVGTVGRQDLSSYRVDASKLDGLEPDEKNVYSRLNRDGTRDDFIKMANGDVYQVRFDPRTQTWQVLDPLTGRPVGTLVRSGKTGNDWTSQWVLRDMPPFQGGRRSHGGGGARRGGGAQGSGGAQGGGGAQRGGGAQGG